MTLSNFDWTDKKSIKWFLMLPTGHEGPYSLESLDVKGISKEVKVWAEGLPEPLSLIEVLDKASGIEEEELPPPLPPLPFEDEDEDEAPVSIPAFEEEENEIEDEEVEVPVLVTEKKFSKVQKYLGIAVLSSLVIFFGMKQWIKSREEVTISRLPKMSPKLHQRINKEIQFQGWDKKIFFKEYVPADMSHIWLITSSFQTCEVEANFSSLKGKLLSQTEDQVSFRGKSVLKNHVAEFSTFDFVHGNKLIPGLYEVDVRAEKCEWDGLVPSMANGFSAPEETYVARFKVVLYNKGNVEFNRVLDSLIRKKLEQELKNQNQEELFWQDLQQKLQTLLAITLQIEQSFLEFLEKDSRAFNKNLKPAVESYTKKFGHFLTKFVVANEEYFKGLSSSELSNITHKQSYEPVVRLTAKNVGFESMKLIETLQTMKKPARKDLNTFKEKVVKVFAKLKEGINHKIIQVTEDRSK